MKFGKTLVSRNLQKALQDPGQILQATHYIFSFTEEFRQRVKDSGRIKALRDVYTEVDEFIQESHEKEKNNKPTCKKGCSFCCHLNVDMTNIEVEAILDYCKENEIPIDYSMFDKQKDLIAENRAYSEFSKCAFLGDDNLCKIYPVRPFNCRTYFVVNDPEKCDTKKYPEGNTLVLQTTFGELWNCAIMNYSGGKMNNMQRLFLEKKKKLDS